MIAEQTDEDAVEHEEEYKEATPEQMQELRDLCEQMEIDDLIARGKCLTCRGRGRCYHQSVGGFGSSWPCHDCGGTGDAPKPEAVATED